MTRTVLTVDLRDAAAVETYTAHHRQVWPEVLESVQRAGIRAMEICILDRRLVMVVETDGRDVQECFAHHHASASPRVAEWEALMRSLLLPPPGGRPGEWWTIMQPVFRFDTPASSSAERGGVSRG